MSKWTEIRNDYFQEEQGKITVFVDAWQDDIADNEEEEEGKVIAKVSGTIGEEPTIEYLDKDAKTDDYAQEIIQESLNVLQEQLAFQFAEKS